ncbi:META domain-containing protein [Galbibacter pacificus]|uniref:META domain-containing protein n=1 Tax=Galbibacter pacificus TaxID=2996052 RepID=A0ABT6FSK0_9FLAO|nr:META domain-containing protein [Galbibacter pacificus]MDG3582646.1 META domain-containing protein [Galbibacter pacificus]MDG3586235.1 META domain-containing protein [Galbibacter pacificus]
MKKVIVTFVVIVSLMACKDAKKNQKNTFETKEVVKITQKEKTKIPEGVDFIASGDNPSWSLLIDFDNAMNFTSLDRPKKLTTPVPEPNIPQDTNALNYLAETEAGILQVTIFKKPCITNANEDFSYKVYIEAKEKDMENYKTFEGCGKYIGDYRLNDIWALETIDGKAIDKTMKRPNLEFNLRNGQVFGFGGCNRINGTLVVEKDSLAIGALASTKMMCPNAELETQFLQIVNNMKFHYKYKNLILTLTSAEHTLTFRKVD